METTALICTAALGIAALVGIFWTKTKGWGRYSTATLILVLVLFLGTSLLIIGKLEAPILGNIVFAVIGYAGGLITNGKTTEDKR